MALSKEALKQGLLGVFNDVETGKIKISSPSFPPPPGMCSEIASSLAEAYHAWVKTSPAMAGALLLVVDGNVGALKTSLVAPLMAGWGPGFSLYWTSAVFTNAGFIPANLVVPTSLATAAAGITADIAEMMNPAKLLAGLTPKSKEETADALATILEKWTKSLQVLSTDTSGTTLIVQVI